MLCSRNVIFMALAFAAAQILALTPSMAEEFKVKCDSLEDCMAKGNKLTKRRKLSLAQEAYRNAVKFDVNDKDAWRKFEILTIRISEEGGC